MKRILSIAALLSFPVQLSLTVLIVAASPANSFADPATPNMHPVEAVCITYEVSGQVQNGTLTRCHRDFGYEQYELQDLKIGVGSFVQAQKQHLITIGDTLYTIDLANKTATKVKNPLYDRTVAGLAKSSPEKSAGDFLAAMGYVPTGAKKKIAGAECTVYNSPSLGSACFTSGALLLEQSIMGNSQVATHVAIGDGGGDANYDIPAGVKVSEGPQVQIPSNLKDLLRPPPQ